MNGVVAILLLLGSQVISQSAPDAAQRAAQADEFFSKGQIPQLRIRVTEEELGKLRGNNRAYVKCTVVEEGGATYQEVGLKLKGAAGSFRDWNDRPALTLNSNKFSNRQSFHGLDKFHLNNSVQDGTYCNEWLCESICRSAGLPAARVSHARVWLNDRDVGLYVLKEGFDRSMLKRSFKNPDGNLYDGGFIQDIDANLERDEGKGPEDRSDLKELVAACRLPDETARFKRVGELLDVEMFITFAAIEAMACHWDGYIFNRNNYRIYFDPQDHKARFLPHGMDQMFGDIGAGVFHHPGAMVASTVMSNRAWRTRYRERVRELLPEFSPERLHPRLDLLQKRVQPVLAGINAQQGREFEDRVRGVKERVKARYENLRQQIANDDPLPPKFDGNGNLYLAEWTPMMETGDTVNGEVDLPGNKKGYLLRCGPGGRCVASWRRKIRLEKGKYEFHAMVQTEDVAAIADDRGAGAGLRISGATRMNGVQGTQGWTPVVYEISVDEKEREVVLVAELRCTKGQAWFDRASLRIQRKP